MFLRDAVIRATGKNPLVLATHFDGQPRADVISGIEEVNFDGFAGFYGFPTRPAQPYAETMATWATATGVQNGFFHIPCASTGVDARPWWLIGWGNAGGINSRPYNPDISLQGFATHLSDVKTYLDADQSDTGKALVIYAWNEWGEGGIIEPSRVRGSAYLDSIRSTFGLTPVSEGVFELPVVLDARGQGMSHFTSDLVVTNRGAVPARVSLTYRSSAGTLNSPPVSTTETIDAGRELRISEVIAYLRDKGLSILPAGSSVVGALSVSVLDGGDPSALFVGSRTSTPNPNTSVGGSFGLFVAATKQSTAPAGIVAIVGLREDSRTRSNLAIVDVPSGTGPASLEIHLYDGDSGQEAGIPIRYALQPGEWKQFGSILGMYGISNGYAIVKRIGGGTNRFLVYGVANDGGESGGGTSDGSYIGSGASAGFVPIVLRVPSGGAAFTSELILTNTNPGPVDAVMTYTPAAQLAAGPSFQTTVTLGGGRQLRIPDVISYFRSRGLPLPAGEGQGGTLNVSGANTLVRTSIPNPDAVVGGSFGLTYPAYSISSRASAGAWIFGLRQDATARSNVAIADARVGDASIIRYVVEVFDSDNGGVPPIATLEPIPLSGGQWYQVSGILAKLGVSHGYVHVRPESGSSDFVVYGVVNDGASPGQGTSDGSYIPMIVTPR